MKYFTGILSALTLVAGVTAFPAAMYEEMARRGAEASRSDIASAVKAYHTKRKAAGSGFDATAQYVSNQGKHAFKPPTNVNTYIGAQRGPCPGLNAMANHGYLPHDGVATIQQLIEGTYEVFGMGLDLGAFLSVYGALQDGNLAGWSIGGPSLQLEGLGSLALLTQPKGMSGSHDKYETDVSPTRPDLYQYGNTYKVIIDQFQQLFDTQPDPATANYNLSVLTPFRAARFQQSISRNPYFYNGVVSGLLVQPAAYTFIYRFMGNKSAEHPEGILNQEVLKSFFSITGESGNFKWTEGHEKIPDNWYKRAIGDEYTVPFFLIDVIAAALEYPQFLDIGGNLGTTNSFVGLDITNLTGGVFNVATLLEGDNLGCFVYEALQLTPDLASGLFVNTTGTLGQFNNALQGAFGKLNCPQLKSFDTSQFSHYPGYTKSQ